MTKKAMMIVPFSTLLNSLRFPSIFFWYFGTFTISAFSFPPDLFGVWIMVLDVVVEKVTEEER